MKLLLVVATWLGVSAAAALEPLDNGVYLLPGDLGSMSGKKREIAELVGFMNVYQRLGLTDGLATALMPVLTLVLRVVTETGVTPAILDTVVPNEVFMNMFADGVIWGLQNNVVDLADTLVGLQRSGLLLDTIVLAANDPYVMPGLIRIIEAYMAIPVVGGETTTSPTAPENAPVATSTAFPESLPEIDSSLEAIFESVLQALTMEDQNHLFSLFARESQLLNDVLTSLNQSGLARQFVQHLVTSEALAEPLAKFVKRIVDSNAVSMSDLFSAFINANIFGDVIGDLIANLELIGKFAEIGLSLIQTRIGQWALLGLMGKLNIL